MGLMSEFKTFINRGNVMDLAVGVIIGDWKGHFWEFGTVNHRAQPMLAPAVDANEGVVIEIFGGRIGARIEGAI